MKATLPTIFRVGFVVLVLALAAVFILAWYSRGVFGTEHRVFTSPDHRFKVVVYRSGQRLGAMPGQAGDAPGTVCLLDARTGKLLARKRVEMVQTIDDVAWSPTNVSIKLFAEWDLP